MAMVDDVPPAVEALAEKMGTAYVQSEFDIARTLATADEPLSVATLSERTGYTERTITKRLGTLDDRLGGEPLARLDGDGRGSLHPLLARALRERVESV
ncbi:hypothetical protein [Haloarchaeobius sp. DFWS5]|uniref:hypothetical protein n=1 Tax=Haloarchaeobius sp. DFWS5 TaxID=3446114 RepID=UPI003EBA1FB1